MINFAKKINMKKIILCFVVVTMYLSCAAQDTLNSNVQTKAEEYSDEYLNGNISASWPKLSVAARAGLYRGTIIYAIGEGNTALAGEALADLNTMLGTDYSLPTFNFDETAQSYLNVDSIKLSGMLAYVNSVLSDAQIQALISDTVDVVRGEYNDSLAAARVEWAADIATAVGAISETNLDLSGFPIKSVLFEDGDTVSASNLLTYQNGALLIGTTNTMVGYHNRTGITSATNNTIIGYNAANALTSGGNNVFIGSAAGNLNATGSTNVYVGSGAGAVATGSNNTFIGERTGYAVEAGGQNTFLGFRAGYTCVNSLRNIFLGSSAGYNETGSDKLYIEPTNSSSPLIYGDFSEDSIKINGSLTTTDTLYLSYLSAVTTYGYLYLDSATSSVKVDSSVFAAKYALKDNLISALSKINKTKNGEMEWEYYEPDGTRVSTFNLNGTPNQINGKLQVKIEHLYRYVARLWIFNYVLITLLLLTAISIKRK